MQKSKLSFTLFGMAPLVALLVGCSSETQKQPVNQLDITGTWKLVSGTTIENSDTSFTDYTKGQEAFKMINETHFVFMRHDLNKGKDSAAVYSAGGGTYSLEGNRYTEHLNYFNVREWEGNQFEFDVKIVNDTLIQSGHEKDPATGVDRIIEEKYVKISL